MQICGNIRQAREAAGKTQQEIANLLGVKRTTYANWEEKTEPSITKIKEIAEILGVSFYDLINVEKPIKEDLYKKRIENLELDLMLLKRAVKSLINDPPDLAKEA